LEIKDINSKGVFLSNCDVFIFILNEIKMVAFSNEKANGPSERGP